MESSAVIKFDYSLKVNDNIITTGWTRHIFILEQTLKPTKPPKIFLDIIILNLIRFLFLIKQKINIIKIILN
jgi:hypothetical protein